MPQIERIKLADSTASEPPTYTVVDYDLKAEGNGTWVYTNPGATRLEDRTLTIQSRESATVSRVKSSVAYPIVLDGEVARILRHNQEFIIPFGATDAEILSLFGHASFLNTAEQQTDYSTSTHAIPLREMIRTGQALF